MENNKAENKAQTEKLSAQAEVSKTKTTLKIWGVPSDVADKFISHAKNKYECKSWLYLKKLMDNETDSEFMRTKIELMEKRLEIIEKDLGVLVSLIAEGMEEDVEEEKKKEITVMGGRKLVKKG